MNIPGRMLTCTLVTIAVALTAACASSGSSDSPTSTRPPGTLTNDQGWPRVEGLRGKRYCEVLLANVVDNRLNANVFNTYGLNDCPDDQWKALDANAIKTERGVIAALLNGPRYWLMDAIEKRPTERQETDFGAIRMFLAATIDLGPIPPNLAAYVEHHIARNTVFEYSQGAQVYELVDPTGRVYIMQSYSQQRDANLAESDLPTLATNNLITPPAGWTYRALTLDATLRVQGPGDATVIQDDLANTYSLIETD